MVYDDKYMSSPLPPKFIVHIHIRTDTNRMLCRSIDLNSDFVMARMLRVLQRVYKDEAELIWQTVSDDIKLPSKHVVMLAKPKDPSDAERIAELTMNAFEIISKEVDYIDEKGWLKIKKASPETPIFTRYASMQFIRIPALCQTRREVYRDYIEPLNLMFREFLTKNVNVLKEIVVCQLCLFESEEADHADEINGDGTDVCLAYFGTQRALNNLMALVQTFLDFCEARETKTGIN